MAGTSYFEVVYPSNGVVLFDGGKNNKFEKSIIPDNESPDCKNVVFANGTVGTRLGSTYLNTTSVGTLICDGIYTRRDDTGAETMVVFHGGVARTWNTNTFATIASAQSVFTAGLRVAATQYRSNIFMGNGGTIPYKYNGTDFTRHGVYAPTNTVSYVTNGAGWVSAGSASYKITFLNSYVAESDVSTGVTISIAASSTVSLTSLPIAPQSYGVNSRRIYRSQNGSAYKLLATISDNTTTTYTDNIDQGSTTAAPPVDNGVPPKFSVCVYHQNRLFVNDAVNPNFVWYSELGEPFTFASTNFFKVGDASSDLVKGLSVFDDSIVVFCENSEWLNYMPTTDDSSWKQIRIKSSYGCKSHYGSWSFNNKLGFPATQNSKLAGFAVINGAAIDSSATLLTTSSAGSDLYSDKIEPDIFDIQETYIPNISSIVYKNKAYISVTYGALNTTNNRIYLFDFSISNLSKSQKFSWVPLTGLTAAQFAVYGGLLYYGSSSNDGHIYQLETSSYIDQTTAIDSYFWTKEYTGRPGHENLIKDFRKVKILVDMAGAYFMNVTWKVDSDLGVGTTKQISINPGGSLWNALIWGSGVWGGGSSQKEIEIPLGQVRGKRIQFKFDNRNTINQRFKVHHMKYTYNIRGTT